MENKEIQEIKVEKELPKTLEEYVIKEIESYKKMNADLAEALRISRSLNFSQNVEIGSLTNKYNELINKLKEDFQPEISEGSTEPFFNFRHSFIFGNNKEKDKYYIDIFNLKEEGEEENEQ